VQRRHPEAGQKPEKGAVSSHIVSVVLVSLVIHWTGQSQNAVETVAIVQEALAQSFAQ
jgi:hypothetical protein